MKKTFVVPFLFLLTLALAGCGLKPDSDTVYSDPDHEKRYRYGSLTDEDGGFSLFGGDDENKGNSGIGVNGFLWRASLDTISFMPVNSADPFGGVILTDWYSSSEGKGPRERLKVNIYILSQQLRADGLRVSVFRQTQDKSGQWIDSPVKEKTARQLEDTILTRARQLWIQQKKK